MEKLFLICALLLTISGSAQYDENKVNRKAVQAYNDAMLQLRDGLIKDALPLLGKAIEYDPGYVDAYLSLAGVYGELKNYQKCIDYYEIARSKDTGYFKYYYLPYSINLAGMGRFADALQAVNKFLTIDRLSDRSIRSGLARKQSYQFALDDAARHSGTNYVFAPINLGDSINSPRSEYYPSITIDDSLLVFTRKGDGIREDFMESARLQPQTAYTHAGTINGDINIEPAKGALHISQDGDWLLFAGNFPRQGFGNFDLYISYSTPTGWSEPQNLGPAINTDFWESAPSLSPDKNTLYFSSDRPGGYGGKDLYVSYRQPNGRWSNAVNMGPAINTKGDEQAPFIHADNRSLYFTSDGLPGYGGSDIFVVRKKDNNEWGVPENLGYPINTIENEGTLYVASDGITAYYASDRADSRGGLDLYRFELRPDVRPIKTLYVKGRVTDIATGKGLPSTVELTNDSNQQLVTRVQTNETGNYFITLPVGSNYTFTVNRKGYLFYSDLYALANQPADTTYQKNIALQPIRVNATVTLKNIQFTSNSFELAPVSRIELDKLVQLLGENPTMHIEISGHTDNTGDAAKNTVLSANRAKAVGNYLIVKGIDGKRLTWKGYGATKPVAGNDTEEGKARNRRTEITVTAI